MTPSSRESGLVKVSVIGIGMRSHAGVAATAFKALAEKSINIKAITTSEIKISILIDGALCELAVRTLHSPSTVSTSLARAGHAWPKA
jgi:aspartate kinase